MQLLKVESQLNSNLWEVETFHISCMRKFPLASWKSAQCACKRRQRHQHHQVPVCSHDIRTLIAVCFWDEATFLSCDGTERIVIYILPIVSFFIQQWKTLAQYFSYFRRSRPYQATTHRDNELVQSWNIKYMWVCVCVCVFCFNLVSVLLHSDEVSWLSLPGTLIAFAHVTPFNKPQFPPFTTLQNRGQRDKEWICSACVCAAVRGQKRESKCLLEYFHSPGHSTP